MQFMYKLYSYASLFFPSVYNLGFYTYTFILIYNRTLIPADADAFKMSSGRLKKVTTSYDQTRRGHDVSKKTSDLRRLEPVSFTSS